MRFGERIRPSGLFPVAPKVLQQRWYFSELLIVHRRSVDKPLGLPCGCVHDDWELMRGHSLKKKPGTEKVLVGMRLIYFNVPVNVGDIIIQQFTSFLSVVGREEELASFQPLMQRLDVFLHSKL